MGKLIKSEGLTVLDKTHTTQLNCFLTAAQSLQKGEIEFMDEAHSGRLLPPHDGLQGQQGAGHRHQSIRGLGGGRPEAVIVRDFMAALLMFCFNSRAGQQVR